MDYSSMKDSICLVTGGTSGVGKAIATGVARLGAVVIITSRSEASGSAAVEEMKRKTGNSNINFRIVDLASIDSVVKLAEAVTRDFGALHLLSNNAAVLPMRREETEDGIEMILAVNYLSHFVLTYSLLELLKKSAPARVITVSGTPSLLTFGRLDLEDLNSERRFNPLRATYRAAVAKVAFSHELAKRLQGSGVTSNTFHPGLVRSNLTRNLPLLLRTAAGAAEFFFSEECETGVHLAASAEVEGVTGKFYKNKKMVDFSPKHSLDSYSGALWRKSMELTGLS